MAEKTIVNYEQLQAIVKKFNTEGEEIAKVLGKLREKVHHMQTEWIGAGSDAFFDEMEMEILPAVQRLSEAMLFSGKTLVDITKIFNNSEEESKNIFKGDFQNVNLGATDFGAGQFGNLGGALGGSAAGASGSEPNLGSTDFGAGQFAGAGGPSDPNSPTSGGSGGPNLGQTDFGAGQFGESGSAGPGGAEQGSQAPHHKQAGWSPVALAQLAAVKAPDQIPEGRAVGLVVQVLKEREAEAVEPQETWIQWGPD